ncbi:unnamed protein product [Amoebophrya sp. A120]|nr:unnamed protein product [Amoebophrya sp. A120]|eukprot:GSA120T00016778001.1
MSWLWDKVGDLIAFVRLPKEVVIENRRLGFLHKLLTLATLIFVLYTSITAQIWNERFVPVHSSVSLWSGSPPAYDASATPLPQHCDTATLAATYNYDWDATEKYRPAQCLPMPVGEHMWKLGSQMYIPTFVQDSLYDGNSTASGRAEWFVANVEEQVFYFNHGYETNTEKSSDEIQQGRDSTQAEIGEPGDAPTTVSGQEGQILTVIQNESGSRECVVGGRSRWEPADASKGINGKLKEWLACAGVNLDSDAPKLKTGLAGEVGTPKMRVTGMQLKLQMVYHNAKEHKEDFEGVVCYVRVRAVPLWNSNQVVAYTAVPSLGSASNADGKYRYRYQYGVSVTLEATGRFSFFDLNALITGIVNALVLLAIPTTVIKVIALNCAGPASAVYTRVQAEPLDLTKAIYGTCARKIVTAQVYKAMIENRNKKRKSSASEPGDNVVPFNEEFLEQKLVECLAQCVQDGHLDEKDLLCMTQSMMHGLDVDRTGTIQLNEFVESCSIGDQVSSTELGAFFDLERERGFLERLFTDRKMRSMINKAHDHEAEARASIETRKSERERLAVMALQNGGGEGEAGAMPVPGQELDGFMELEDEQEEGRPQPEAYGRTAPAGARVQDVGLDIELEREDRAHRAKKRSSGRSGGSSGDLGGDSGTRRGSQTFQYYNETRIADPVLSYAETLVAQHVVNERGQAQVGVDADEQPSTRKLSRGRKSPAEAPWP